MKIRKGLDFNYFKPQDGCEVKLSVFEQKIQDMETIVLRLTSYWLTEVNTTVNRIACS